MFFEKLIQLQILNAEVSEDISTLVEEICLEIEGQQVSNKAICDHPNCFAIKFSTIASNSGMLSAEYYIPHSQAEAVRNALSANADYKAVLARVWNMVSEKKVSTGKNTTFLNNDTVDAIMRSPLWEAARDFKAKNKGDKKMKKEKLRKKTIGQKWFEGEISVTDPCYDKDVWCRMDGIKVASGNYTCIAWMFHESYEWNGKSMKDTRVGSCGIYLDGVIPHQFEDYEEIGEIGVDAGLAGFFMNKPDYSDSEWAKFCDRISKGNAWIFEEGFFTSSGYGDGGYPVYAAKNEEGDITSLEIRFV